MKSSTNRHIMSPKLLVLFSVLVVATQAVELRFGHDLPHIGFDLGRIIGGEEAIQGEFPHQVSLQWSALPALIPYEHFCGGSIINNKWILTAGHCVLAVPPIGSFVVKAGKHNIQLTEGGEQMVRVEKSIIHKDYPGNVAPYDIALLRLETPLSLNEAVSTISLPKNGAKPSGNTILSGWGSISPSGMQMPSKLQKVVLPILTLEECKSKLESIVGPSPLHSTNVCTGSNNRGQSACSGDSGGALIKENASGDAEVIGIVSWGIMPCGSSNAPSVYVDVAQFNDWIAETIRNN